MGGRVSENTTLPKQGSEGGREIGLYRVGEERVAKTGGVCLRLSCSPMLLQLPISSLSDIR